MKTMFRIIPIAILILMLFHREDSFCQFKNTGIKAGFNLANADIEYPFGPLKTINKGGFNITAFYDFLNYHYLTLTGEAGYSQKGFTEEVIVTNEFGVEQDRYKIYNRMNYIDVSVIAKLILRKKSFSPYISAGPVITIFPGYNVSFSDNYKPSINYDPADNLLLNELKKTTVGFKGGIGAEINNILTQTIILESRYFTDLTNSFNNGLAEFKRNRLFELNLGIKF